MKIKILLLLFVFFQINSLIAQRRYHYPRVKVNFEQDTLSYTNKIPHFQIARDQTKDSIIHTGLNIARDSVQTILRSPDRILGQTFFPMVNSKPQKVLPKKPDKSQLKTQFRRPVSSGARMTLITKRVLGLGDIKERNRLNFIGAFMFIMLIIGPILTFLAALIGLILVAVGIFIAGAALLITAAVVLAFFIAGAITFDFMFSELGEPLHLMYFLSTILSLGFLITSIVLVYLLNPLGLIFTIISFVLICIWMVLAYVVLFAS